jgi:hypothetical protein
VADISRSFIWVRSFDFIAEFSFGIFARGYQLRFVSTPKAAAALPHSKGYCSPRKRLPRIANIMKSMTITTKLPSNMPINLPVEPRGTGVPFAMRSVPHQAGPLQRNIVPDYWMELSPRSTVFRRTGFRVFGVGGLAQQFAVDAVGLAGMFANQAVEFEIRHIQERLARAGAIHTEKVEADGDALVDVFLELWKDALPT